MTTTKLDLTGLNCPLPALKTRKALKSVTAGDFLEVHCTDPLSVIDIPNLIRETGDKVEITGRDEKRIVFLIEKSIGSARPTPLLAAIPVLNASVAGYCSVAASNNLCRRMGMGSPDNRRKADDSCRALCVGRSMSELLHDKQLVRFSCAARKGGA